MAFAVLWFSRWDGNASGPFAGVIMESPTPSGTLLPPDGPRGRRRLRIVRGIARELLQFLVLTALAPLVLLGAAAVDLALWLRSRKPWMAVRLVALVWWFLLGELRGLLGCLRVWLLAGGPWGRDSRARRRRTYRLQVNWAANNLDGLRRLCRVRFVVEGGELIGRGPMIVMTRHTSIADNALPAALISRAHGIDLRYALKRELQSLPALDIGARWVPTCFVDRSSADPAREIARVRTLASGLSSDRDGVLIYPEGTRCTPAKLAALKARTDIRDAELRERIGRLAHLLPPRLGGPLALLDEAPDAAIVVCGHVGLDGFHHLRQIWSGALVGSTVHVRFWRHEREDVPSASDEQAAWLYDRWQELDDWVSEQHAPKSTPVEVRT
jgi:1-acyl-sn-glycerol-3-phosphate acyltransferase